MKIVFCSNFLNYHQKKLCESIIGKVGIDNFRFVAFGKMSEDRKQFGFLDMSNNEYVINYSTDNDEEVYKCIESADYAIVGSAPDKCIDIRMKNNKDTFVYTERPFKKGQYRRFIPRTYRKVYNRFIKYKNKNLFVLCAGYYVVDDLKKIGFNSSKCFSWGYFPEFIEKKENKSINKLKINILWVGRFLDWKRPKMFIKLAKQFKNNRNISFTMIGEGSELEKCKKYIKNWDLSNVTLLGAMSPDKVREYMINSDVFITTSTKYEGWGAVINEAMNSGCITIANEAMGATKYLIKNGENGFVFKKYSQLVKILRSIDLKDNYFIEIKTNAYETIKNVWNAENAVDRLFDILENKDLSTYKSQYCDYYPCKRLGKEEK